jgi:hypothetical protein
MRILFVSFALLVFCGYNAYSQNTFDFSAYHKYEEKYAKYSAYTDKNFPQNETDIAAYKYAMEEYAKLHPPLPKKKITGNTENDEIYYLVSVDNWYAAYPFFPKFIPYHKFQKNRSLQDDEQSYEDAVKVWMGKNENIVNELKNK